MNDILRFKCGCEFPINDTNGIDLNFDITQIPLDCIAVWSMLATGNSKGVFQLESNFGQTYCKKLRPENIDHLAALGAILRPGCVSGDTKVITNILSRRKTGTNNYKKVQIKEIFHNQQRYKRIISYNEQTRELEQNTIKQVYYNGVKDIFKLNFKKSNRTSNVSHYNLECTDDHLLLTTDGWKMLKDLKTGDRFAILKHHGTQQAVKYIKGKGGFRAICFKHYHYKCVFCDWKEASLDVNHLEGNRFTNNEPDNLCFMCPNHHKMYTENKIDKETIINARKPYILPVTDAIEWGEYIDKIYVGKKDVYDISVEGPNHNFIAGNIVVHNCSETVLDGKTITQHYIDRKNGEEAVTYFHMALEDALKATYGVMCYQEQAIQISKEIGGFTEEESESVRKSIGKKDTELMAKVRKMFLEACEKINKVTKSDAEEIFNWIEKSQRYLFNASHAYSYSMNGYLTAYAKAHFPKQFFTSYLCYATEKPKPQKEINELVYNAKSMNIDVRCPSFLHLNKEFELIDDSIYFGLSNIKKVGESVIIKLEKVLADIKFKTGKGHKDLNWIEFLLLVSPNIKSDSLNSMICAGALSHFGLSRTRMWYEYGIMSQLSNNTLLWIEKNGLEYKTLSDLLLAITKLPVGRGQACSNKNILAKIIDLQKSLENPPYPLDDLPSWVENIETELLGVPLTCSTIDECNIEAANASLLDFLNEDSRKSYLIACHIDEVKEIKTKKGKNPGQIMAFIRASDITAKLDSIVAFPEQWEKNRNLLIEGNNVIIGGVRGKDKNSFMLNNVWALSSKF